MEIFPAIDLQKGQCVRLTQGDFNAVTIYEADPLRQADKFIAAGASWLHMVDLDGARAGSVQQLPLITQVAQQKKLKLQVGGGLRDAAMIEQLLTAGVERVVIGSLAVKQPALVQEWLRLFGADRIVLAFDVRLNAQQEPEILTHGWQTGSQQSLWDMLALYADSGLKTILCTDVSRDGMLAGSNNALYQAIQKRWPSLDILASGGVKDQNDLIALHQQGLAGAIVGKAIYEGRVDLAAAIQAVRSTAHAG